MRPVEVGICKHCGREIEKSFTVDAWVDKTTMGATLCDPLIGPGGGRHEPGPDLALAEP